MRIGDRVLLVITMLLGIAAFGYLFAIIWDMLPMQNFMQTLYRISNAWYYRIGSSALIILMMIAFVKLMFIRMGSKQVQLKDGIPISQNGDVRITVDALRQMCEEVAKQDQRIDLTGCNIQSAQQGLTISVNARCKGEQNIAVIVEALQSSIRHMLNRTCGITNAKVQVLVEKAEIVPSGSKEAVTYAQAAKAVTAAQKNGELETVPKPTDEDTKNG